MSFITKRADETRAQYWFRLMAAIIGIVVIGPVVAITVVLVPAVMVLELPPFLLAVVIGLLAWGLIRLRHGVLNAPPSARHGHPHGGSRSGTG
jgi:uncharacterized membrane-anchored protein